MTNPAFRFLSLAALVSCSSISAAQTRHITIRVIDERTGERVPKQRLLIFAGHDPASADREESSFDVTTGPSGTAELSLPATIQQIKMYTEWRTYCEKTSAPPMFNVTQIISHGITAPNACGRAHVQDQPGTVIVYLRPQSLWEKMQH